MPAISNSNGSMVSSRDVRPRTELEKSQANSLAVSGAVQRSINHTGPRGLRDLTPAGTILLRQKTFRSNLNPKKFDEDLQTIYDNIKKAKEVAKHFENDCCGLYTREFIRYATTGVILSPETLVKTYPIQKTSAKKVRASIVDNPADFGNYEFMKLNGKTEITHESNFIIDSLIRNSKNGTVFLFQVTTSDDRPHAFAGVKLNDKVYIFDNLVIRDYKQDNLEHKYADNTKKFFEWSGYTNWKVSRLVPPRL